MAHVQVDHLCMSYQQGPKVLQELSLEVKHGEMFFLLGSSGCGKSTLLRILAGLLKPNSGKIFFDGRDISSLPAEKRRAAMVFQNYALWPHMSVFENVAFGLETMPIPKLQIRERVLQTLEQVRLESFAERKVTALSGGQQQRVALARALAVDPAVLLLDEPLSNLDARLRDQMRREIRRICTERNLTALYVTHDRQEALSMADRLAVLHEGQLQQVGAPEEVYDRPCNRFVAGFLGETNFLEGTLIEQRLFRCPLGDFALQQGESLSAHPSSLITAAIRPERIHFATSAHAQSFPATLIGRTFMGEKCEWRFQAAGIELLMIESAPSPRTMGQEYRLAFDPNHLVLLKG